jgi:hypothetical protein
MSKMFPLAVFTAVFAVVYYACFVFGYTPVRYYPLLNELSTQDLPRTAGPAMGWYTWIVVGAVAGLVAGLVALLVPKGASERLAMGLSWIAPIGVIIWIMIVEWHWFVGK